LHSPKILILKVSLGGFLGGLINKINMKVKKIVAVAFIALSCVSFSANAQDVFGKNDKVVSLGVGLGSYYGSGYKTTFIPVSGSFEYGIVDGLINGKAAIGVGGYLGYTANKWEYANSVYGWEYSHFLIGARGLFHYQFVNNLDTYAGLFLGYDITSSKSYGNHGGTGSADGSNFVFSPYIGARYYFTDNFAAFAELGYGISILELGVSLKF
jgi:hypothetical protein